MSVINTNVASLNSQRNLKSSETGLTTSLQRLSTGLRINSAKDDAAGLAISERMTAQIRGSNQASRNANDGISLAQTAEGDLGKIGDSLQRMRELSVQAANASNSDSDRVALQTEVGQLKSEIERIAKSSSFNGVKLLDGSFNAQTFQIGANNTENDKITVNKIANASVAELGGSTSQFQAALPGSNRVSSAAFKEGDVTLNGFAVGKSVDGSENGGSADSAKAKAAAINAISAQSGVYATAQATEVKGGAISGTAIPEISAANSFSINGVSVGDIAGSANGKGMGANVAAAINKISEQTGVTATADASTGELTLTAKDGRNVELKANNAATDQAAVDSSLGAATGLKIRQHNDVIPAVVKTSDPAADATANATAANAAATANDVGITRGKIELTSTSASGINIDGADTTKAGVAAGTTAVTATKVAKRDTVAEIDVSTVKGASDALNAIDGALKQVNESRSDLGALQNRFSSVVTGLATTTENLSASRSRITDTDFASETANMTRSQILQQAGTAMLAQANQLPNSVMSLLRG